MSRDKNEINPGISGWTGKFFLTKDLIRNPVFIRNYTAGPTIRKSIIFVLLTAAFALGLGSRLFSGLADFSYRIFGIVLVVLLVPILIRCVEMICKIPVRMGNLPDAGYSGLYEEKKINSADVLKGESLPGILRTDRIILYIACVCTGLLAGWYIGALIYSRIYAQSGLTGGTVNPSEFRIILWLMLFQFWMLSKVIMIMMILVFALAGSGVSLARISSGVLSVIFTILLVIVCREYALRLVENFFELPEWYRDQFFYFLHSPGWEDFRVSLSFAILEVGFIGLGAWITYFFSLMAIDKRLGRSMVS